MQISLYDSVNDPALFEENQPGEYTFYANEYGKGVCGVLTLAEEPARDANAQRQAGGDLRRGNDHALGADDGGHLIGARFGGESAGENLIAQNRNFNRGAYKRMENQWARELEAGNKVFVNLEYEKSERPEAIQGFAIIESPDGRREIEYYSLYNESAVTRESWEEAAESQDYFYEQEPNGQVTVSGVTNEAITGEAATESSENSWEGENSHYDESNSASNQQNSGFTY